MYACAASGQAVYGLFAQPDGTQTHFALLANIGAGVSSVASFDGSEVLAGTTNGRIVVVDAASRTFVDTDVSGVTAPGLAIDRLLCATRWQRYAISAGVVLDFDGSVWHALSGGPSGQCVAIEFAPAKYSPFRLVDGGRPFGATDWAVYASDDEGRTWVDASAGLPRRAHVSDLRLASYEDGEQWLYMASNGWSVWRTQVDEVEVIRRVHELDPSQIEILFGIVNDGGGLGVPPSGGGVVRVPPRQPVTDILLAVLVSELSARMADPSRREIRATAFAATAFSAAREQTLLKE